MFLWRRMGRQLLAGFPNAKSLMQFFAPTRNVLHAYSISRLGHRLIRVPGFPDGEIAWAECSVAPEEKARLSRVRLGLRWLSVQLLFEFIDQFLIVGLDAKISVPSYWTVFSVFARDLIFQRRE